MRNKHKHRVKRCKCKNLTNKVKKIRALYEEVLLNIDTKISNTSDAKPFKKRLLWRDRLKTIRNSLYFKKKKKVINTG